MLQALLSKIVSVTPHKGANNAWGITFLASFILTVMHEALFWQYDSIVETVIGAQNGYNASSIILHKNYNAWSIVCVCCRLHVSMRGMVQAFFFEILHYKKKQCFKYCQCCQAQTINSGEDRCKAQRNGACKLLPVDYPLVAVHRQWFFIPLYPFGVWMFVHKAYFMHF